jgi:hypothetical protein
VAVYDTKVIQIPMAAQSFPDVNAWFRETRRGKDVEVEIIVRSPGRTGRMTKREQESEFNAIFDAARGVWKEGDYDFNFLYREFFWRGKRITLSLGEMILLYRTLILKEVFIYMNRYFIVNMRTRLGKDFLRDAGIDG